MGATDFFTRESGRTPREAFDKARDRARHLYGHGGYTGSIAEKRDFVMIKLPAGKDPDNYAVALMEDPESAVHDKHGPAGCFDLDRGLYLFFGYASS